ncbi:Patatin-like phospholipase [Caballeronia choica]|uniref:Patatin-like phospholipase n=1 Tax=Caballeronia choica TaxID=326476 RepID=A0A158JW76_9BURK|nr:patatin-like phospholipase family protein [Caballeronia choica]SAL73224.1 Patatin-like phospholipase [Caballeronia choica]
MSQNSPSASNEKFIPRVSPADLSAAIKSQEIDPSSQNVIAQELPYLSKWRKQNNRPTDPASIAEGLSGLAISGGGIRSATFALGVVQALAHQEKMRYFDYLSTVSGGGYLGCSLTWLTSPLYAQPGTQKSNFSMAKERFPYGTDSPSEAKVTQREADPDQDQQLIYLRQHGKYLAPGEGIDLVSGVAVLLRGMALNALVWLPLAASLCFVLFFIARGSLWPSWMVDLLSFMFPPNFEPDGFTVVAAIGGVALVFFAAYALAYSAATCITGKKFARRYQWRRDFESIIRYPLWVFVACIPIALLPKVFAFFDGSTATGVISTFIGAITAVWTHLTARNSRTSQGPFLSIFATVGAFLVLYGLALTAYAWAYTAFDEFGWCMRRTANPYTQCLSESRWTVALLLFAIIALLSGWFANINLISMHRFYRDRLMEAYMPEPSVPPNKMAALRSGRAPAADKARLSEFCKADAEPYCPYPLINTNVILTGSEERTWRLRGGDSFLLSPRMCGSNATGWCDTTQFLGNDMTLATAMAISGAAANPDAGGELLRNRFVALLMAFANVRLGYWVANPGQFRGSARHRNHFTVGWREVSSHFNESAKLVELTDGGHFDNLGLYELIRRRARFIMLCDGTADPDFSFRDFIQTLSRIKADFGASVDFMSGSGLATFIPKDPGGYPQTALFAENGFAAAKIVYADETEGDLLYITSTLIAKVGLDVRGYKAAYSDFPDQTTADQFFDEAQFEAYRALGYTIAESMLRDRSCRELIDKWLGDVTPETDSHGGSPLPADR